jgi:SecY interacting protein Syd
MILLSIKEAMNQYFIMRKEIADEGLDFLFKTPYNEDVDSVIYVGEVDEEEYILWKPVEKNDYSDFKCLEEDLGVKLHQAVTEYFNAYWFIDLDGFIKHHYIKLESSLPGAGIDSYISLVKGYKANHNNRLENIPLGIEGNGLIVVVDNKDGSVKLEDFERSSFEVISLSIEELITTLRLKK